MPSWVSDMAEDGLTADLDPDELPWLERVAGILERVNQSGMIETQQAHDDIERLISVLRAVRER